MPTYYRFFYVVLMIEVLLLAGCLSAIIAMRLGRMWTTRRSKESRKALSDRIVEVMQGQKELAPALFPKSWMRFEDLLHVTEQFASRFADVQWEEIKQFFLKEYLFPRALRDAHSVHWTHRNLAARVFALQPLREHEEVILSLLEDSLYLVRSVAAFSASRLESYRAVYAVLKRMSLEPGFARCLYRDALMQGSKATRQFIEEVAAKEPDPHIHLVCLDILASRMTPTLMPLIRRDLFSPDPDIRLAALKILAQNPDEEFLKETTQSLRDPSPAIRAAAAEILGTHMRQEAATALASTLKDGEWSVRVQAALALRKMGAIGQRILSLQDSDIDPAAYEAAQYVLSLPE
jgi:HEAT repeat protein